jgi:hypothetical protein
MGVRRIFELADGSSQRLRMGTRVGNGNAYAGTASDVSSRSDGVFLRGRRGASGGTLVRVDVPENVLAGALSTAFHQVLAKQGVKKQVGSKAKART